MDIHSIVLKKISIILQKMKIVGISLIRLKTSENEKFGDYQINGIINIAKKNDIEVSYLSQCFIFCLKKNKIFSKIEMTKLGFINLFLNTKWIERLLLIFFKKKNFCFYKTKNSKIILDYSSPNLAKSMHIGHIRSTIIGDCFARVFSFLGNKVIRINHLGDWGINFGILIAYIIKYKIKKYENILFLDAVYKKARKMYEKDKEFSYFAENCAFKLQNKDKLCTDIWKRITNVSIKENQKIYNLLDIKLSLKNNLGESFYNTTIKKVIEKLKYKKIANNKNNKIVVFLKNFKNRDNKNMGVILKKNGLYLYAATEIACLKYRYKKFLPKKIIYCIDTRQKQHLMQSWEICRKASFVPKNLILQHYNFGMILNSKRKPFKTRSGKTVNLKGIINRFIKDTKKVIFARNSGIQKEKLEKLSQVLGIGSIKYFELSKNRKLDYVFNFDNMLKFKGNTVLYIQYTYCRILSLLKKNKYFSYKEKKKKIIISSIEEKKLAIQILRLGETLSILQKFKMPNILCEYLYKIALLFSIFYEKFNIMNSKKNKKISRLHLSYLSAKIIKLCLNFLGIKTVKEI
ncbi:arginine--tRNA ligase [bacterium endosymbiont of Pedicinus badii]|uniref:arginine--tRNA ligase n=1 Tax=bacterium endosymbiont of Pedicinus badii TaxID=1719126 RepID=UPI0009BB0DAE|nr:arginine--tRNA ligase [bacterium endosymbiont of Pedicinus badii]OQM34433.1 hypothetical protein AOQ89_00900 [bacterium endosymbiont of Pedicinus badii]